MASTPPSSNPRGRLAIGGASIVLLLLIWKLLAAAVGADIVLPPPERVLGQALALYPTPKFLAALGATFLRGLTAFTLSLLLGATVGFAAGLSPRFDAALAPLLTMIRATPVLALILIALFWFPSSVVPIFAAFLMAFPIMVTSAASGAKAADPRLLEMSRLFRVPKREEFFGLRLPAAAPSLLAGAKSALGLSWKVVVAGEVLSQPIHALGSGMQDSRVLLETPSVLAWAAASVLLCGLTEWLFGIITSKAAAHAL
jgi:NitT/TauT family transport system permease protein